MNARLLCQNAATLSQRRVSQFLQFVQSGKFGLEFLPKIPFGIGGDSALSNVNRNRCDRGNNKHDRERELGAKTGHFPRMRFLRKNHGKSTCAVSPFFNWMFCARVVLLSI